MNLYNLMHGFNQNAGAALKMANLDYVRIPRFRDAYINEKGLITVLTRTGGNNREDYYQENGWLSSHDNYVTDHDDSFDNTYALWYFKPLPEYEDLAKAVGAKEPDLREKYASLIAKLTGN